MAGRGRLQRNERFFGQAAASASGDAGAEAKVRRAFQRCAESGVLNLSGQNLKGDLPASICGFQEESWAENWWEQYPVTKIDISHNEIQRIPPEICRLAECASFVALSNALQELPAELFTELPLKQLNFRQNQLVALPPGEALACAEQLVELVLSENQLSCLPAELFDLPSLEVLEVSGNSVAGLSDHEWGCSRLRRLDLSQNALGPRLPSRGLHRCSVLRELSLAGNTLEELGETFVLPPQHAWRTSLVSLDLSANRLGPSLRISGLEALDCLQVSSNRISSLELGGRFPRLSALVAQSNQISEFPAALLPDTAPNLATLDLMNNDLNSLPPELGLNQALKRIQLAGNPMRTVKQELLRGSAENLKRFLRGRIEGGECRSEEAAAAEDRSAVLLRAAAASGELALEDAGLEHLPSLPAGLQVLRAPGNALTARALVTATVDAGLGDSLHTLDAARNRLGEDPKAANLLPYLLSGLPRLRALDLSTCGLTASGTPESWGWVRGAPSLPLTSADLSGNELVAPPAELLTACPQLHELRLRRNRICSLDALAPVCSQSLATVDLEENVLHSVPPWLPSRLPRLRSLLLANNCVGPSLPPEWGFWESLQTVSLVGNPLKGIRQTLVTRGWPSVAEHLRGRLPEGAPPAVRPPAAPPAAGAREPAQQAAAAAEPQRPLAPPAEAVPAALAAASPPPPPGAASTAAAALGPRLEQLRAGVAALEGELSAPGINRARMSSLTHTLRMRRAELLKVERELRRAAGGGDGG